MKPAGGGSIVMVGSIAPNSGPTEIEAPYGISKAAVSAVMYGIARAGGPVNNGFDGRPSPGRS
jgi:NAD(P)-dependent dehydrogenase (short-subunit alcohol dehydrogenase family)